MGLANNLINMCSASSNAINIESHYMYGYIFNFCINVTVIGIYSV